jgi:protein SCO1/2
MMRVAKIAAIGAAAVFAALFVGWWQVDGPGADSAPGKRSLPLTAMEFSLTDQDGRDVGPETLIGEPSLVFFGFTYCPDVCPTTLSDISGWLDETMAEYVSYFHPQIQGWTGLPDQIGAIADGFRATYEKVEGENGEYTMNHTAGVFLFDATGRFVTTIDYHEPREFAVPKIRRAMQNRTERAES